MQVSFIVTSYNIDAYIGQCLDSLCACVAPGDQVIVVDDGSTDDSVARIRTALAELPWPDDVARVPVCLGQNTLGGVGIAANIGLTHADRDAVFFVDGDDWLEPAGFAAARSLFESSGSDILIANYQVYDEAIGHSVSPSDAHLWSMDVDELSPQSTATRDLALSLNGVPWRKFYRRAFLDTHELRFVEGDFFYEDNPFHWAVCLRAETIGFLNVSLAQHRMNRPGQTMADAGHGFAAMFTHYETILADIEAVLPEVEQAADRWLATNMAWQLERISPAAIPGYAHQAAGVICGARAPRWQALCDEELAVQPVGYLIACLLQGGAVGLQQAWVPWQSLRLSAAQNERLAQIERHIADLRHQSTEIRDFTQDTRSHALAARNQAEFLALDMQSERVSQKRADILSDP